MNKPLPTKTCFHGLRSAWTTALSAVLLCLFCVTANALPQQALVPGGIAMLKLSNYTPGTKVRFEGRRVAVFEHNGEHIALAGIALNQPPGVAGFSIEYPNGLTLNTKIDIQPKSYEEQHLTIKNKRKVNPHKQDMQRIASESRRKKKAKSVWSDTAPKVDFIWPVEGEISSVFGLRRFFNGQARRPHTGLDIAAAEGTPIAAVADGTVVEAGDFFFSGNMVFIDHGQGIISYYAHMQHIDVKPGQRVEQGQVIGAVGKTGRVTGPHLHLSVIANGSLIDPLLMLPPRQGLARSKDTVRHDAK